jgi:type I restriction enzyme S subunit
MVPNGWEVKNLEDLASVERGKFSARPRNDPKYYGGEIPFVQTGDIAGAKTYLKSYSQTLNEEGLKVSRLFPKNTILITIAANIGDVAITSFDVACPDSLVAIQPKEGTNVIWLYFYLETCQKELDGQATQNAQKNINLQVLRPLNILTPLFPEQQKIAKILSTWDEAISTTERLIENSTQQKKALMQQLLTGKKRLFNDEGKRFEGEWEEIKLGSLYSFKRGKGISKGQLTENGNKCVLYGELYTHYGEVIHEVKSRTREINSVKSIKGDVLIPASTTTTGIDLANATAVLEDDILLGGDINILRPKKATDAIFMAHLLTHIKKFEIARKGQGITIIHVYGKDLANLDVLTPKDLKEQQKIAIVLTNADKEIELLEQQLANFQQEKKALMQVLLTGKKRVVVDGEVI